MTVTAAVGAANLVAPSAGRSPSIGTLADGETPAIVCTDFARVLIPSATLGIATSHTWIFVGEPDQTNQLALLMWGGSTSVAPTYAFESNTGAGNVAGRVADTTNPQIAKTSGLQSLTMRLDDTGNTIKLYRNGAELGSSAYSTSVAIGTYSSVGVLGSYDSTIYGAKGNWVRILYFPCALSVDEMALIHRALRDLYPALA